MLSILDISEAVSNGEFRYRRGTRPFRPDLRVLVASSVGVGVAVALEYFAGRSSSSSLKIVSIIGFYVSFGGLLVLFTYEYLKIFLKPRRRLVVDAEGVAIHDGPDREILPWQQITSVRQSDVSELMDGEGHARPLSTAIANLVASEAVDNWILTFNTRGGKSLRVSGPQLIDYEAAYRVLLTAVTEHGLPME